MDLIGFNKKFTLLCQEAHLAKNTILSGFELLLKANFYQNTEGNFYSAFFHLSIGFERLLKLAVVTHHMLSNDYRSPTIKELRRNYGHNVEHLYLESRRLIPLYSRGEAEPPPLTEDDEAVVRFLSDYGDQSRYFNLNEICEAKMERSPLYKWLDIAVSLYEEYTPAATRERSALKMIYKMDSDGLSNGFTMNLDENGHPMTRFDCYHRQYVVEKAAPLAIWRLVETFRPIHHLLEAMAHSAREYERSRNITQMVVPHYEDFFYFLLAGRDSIKRRKRWLAIFSS
ncbi:hypothetical protein [Paraburkholderia fungorum]|uniref:hypothetical protein n=1 Tax=Paraburkholderia fungorum TaxID=134537 RepID=UPI000425B0E4|nr:hypothetical protein [Paraburkholderia fungorum]PZR50379.1 MAG: hypothetical protein DI523_04680 [Paraburkholderia fungorum]